MNLQKNEFSDNLTKIKIKIIQNNNKIQKFPSKMKGLLKKLKYFKAKKIIHMKKRRQMAK